MSALQAKLLEQVAAWSVAEIAAAGFAVLYLLLAIREHIWCWYCAAVSTALYAWLFVDAKLYMESLLNVFYFGMAAYGWTVWRAGGRTDAGLPVTAWPARVHVLAIGTIAMLVAACGYLLSTYSDAAFPYIDSATTFAAIWATFLVARKVLENWWYWLLIDVVSVFIFWSRGLELTALLFVVYVIMIPFGLISWTRSYQQRQRPLPA